MEFLKSLTFDQFFGADIEDEGTIGRPKQTVYLVDADVAVFGCFPDGQCGLQMDRHFGACAKRMAKDQKSCTKTGNGTRLLDWFFILGYYIKVKLPLDILFMENYYGKDAAVSEKYL